MMPEFVRCEFCKSQIPSETCEFVTHSKVIDGKQYLFCCEQCAERYNEKKRKKTK